MPDEDKPKEHRKPEDDRSTEPIYSISDASAPKIGSVVFRPGVWNIYTITEQDFEILQVRGSDAELDLNILIAALTSLINATAVLYTGQMSPKVETWWQLVLVVSAALTIIFSIKWIRKRSSFKKAVSAIKSRRPPA